MKKVLIRAENVTKEFTQNGVSNRVLDGITADIYKGDFTVIMGASGAGKSTLLYALSGMDKITFGTVKYGEKEISGLTGNQMAKLRTTEFGFIFQQTHLVSNLTLLENVAVAGYNNKERSAAQVDTRANRLLEQMNVSEAADRLPSQVSGGEAQRAAIARAMINFPALLFADEPTGALNKSNTEEVLNLLTELNNNGQSILMVTHDVRAAVRGNRIIYLEDGKILDIMELSQYKKEEAKVREKQLNDWLSATGW